MGIGGVLSKRLGAVVAGVALAVGMLGASSPAEARHRHHRHYKSSVHVRHYVHIRKHRAHRVARAAASAGGPLSAEIVVDANTGRMIYGHNEHELRHPASITKVMTLYLLFEQLDKGKLSLGSEIPISAHAAAQAPSKLGLRPGSTIEVEDAIKAVVTKSANDIAVAVAEAVGGDEETFAEMMTRKARSIGMTHTHYANASGLPNPSQITTAHDLAILGRAIQDRFPKYYRYFSTRSFTFAGRVNRNHNHLLGAVEGMDGIKTGYTAKSGFNLLTSVKRDGRHIVAVVLGGRSGHSRDMRMANLIEEHIDSGAAGRSVTAIAENNVDDAPAERAAPVREPMRLAAVDPARVEPSARIEPPARIETVPVKAEARVQPAVARAEAPSLRLAVPATPVEVERARAAAEKPRPAYVAGAARSAAPADVTTTSRISPASTATPSSLRWTTGAQPAAAKTRPAKAAGGRTEIAKSDARSDSKSAAAAEPKSIRPGWMIQIGATEDAAKANELLARAKGHSRTAAAAQAFTEKVQKGKETLWRARFAGLQEGAAENACRELKRSGFACIAMKN